MKSKKRPLHKSFYSFNAETNFELGCMMGAAFKQDAKNGLKRSSQSRDWERRNRVSDKYLDFTENEFPSYVEELRGFAEGSGVSFADLWPMVIGSDLSQDKSEKCTAIVTNDGSLIGSTEDFDASVKDEIYIVQKTIRDITVFEFYYSYSLGGESISINSNGIVQLTNSLVHTDHQVGIPRNVISRWLSETAEPVNDFEKLNKLTRASGYSHTITSLGGPVWNIEMTSKNLVVTKNKTPFIHTNHYLSELARIQSEEYKEGVGIGTYERYESAIAQAKKKMTEGDLRELLSDNSLGKEISIFNERTIARILINLKTQKAFVWMLREKELGWVEYELDFL
ncbi:MAG: C45 family peptidase [Patescibacteria group bacterium]|nr:C45 family peptidase [Patescibacteria group bacterium]